MILNLAMVSLNIAPKAQATKEKVKEEKAKAGRVTVQPGDSDFS